MRRAVNLQRLVVDVLAAGREVDAQQFGMAARAHQVHIEEGLGQAAAPTDLDPAQVGIAAACTARPVRKFQVAVVEVLQVHVAHDAVVADDQLDDARSAGHPWPPSRSSTTVTSAPVSVTSSVW